MQEPVCGICGAPVRRFSATLWVHVKASVAPHAVELAYVDRPSEWIRRARNRELPTRVER